MSYKHLFVVGALMCSTNFSLAETKIEHQCTDALFDVARVLMAEKSTLKINQAIIKSTKYAKVRQYIRTKWIPTIKSNPDFTPNSFVIDAYTYIKECAQFATPK